MPRYHFVIFITIIIATIVSCTKIVPEPNIPAYLQIDSFAYVTNNLVDSTKSNSHKIENVWVYIDNALIGVYVLPAKIAVLKKGDVTVELRPGIKQNGISATRVSYPFYQTYTETINLQESKTYNLHPSTSYFNFVKTDYFENFDRNTILLEKEDITKGVGIKSETDGVNNMVGKILLTGNDTLCELVSSKQFPLPIGGRDVYLEINYKCNTFFTFGIVAFTPTSTDEQQIFTFNKTVNENGDYIWKKIYIHMTPEVSNNSTAIDYRIYFRAIKRAVDSDAHIWLDNIKVLH